ncbi:hypothetical protein BVRB_023530, partial [Beta vulgaris subsp. vulgaris]
MFLIFPNTFASVVSNFLCFLESHVVQRFCLCHVTDKRYRSVTDTDAINALCHMLSLVVASLNRNNALSAVLKTPEFTDLVQDAFALARRPLFAIRFGQFSYCIMDVILEVMLGTGNTFSPLLADLKKRYDEFEIDVTMLTDIIRDVHFDRDVEYQLPLDYGYDMRATQIKFFAVSGSGLRDGVCRAVEGLWLTWASFVQRFNQIMSHSELEMFDERWQRVIRRKTVALLPEARSKTDRISHDLQLINDPELCVTFHQLC